MYNIQSFHGLNTVSDPLRLGHAWLRTADNVHVTDTGALVKRDGYQLVSAGAYSSAFSTFDYECSYFVLGNQLVDFSGVVLATLTSTAPMYWAEINNRTYYNNGTDSGIIARDNTVLPWSWETPAAPTLTPITGSLAPGLWQVLCTYVLADGRETGAGESAEITLTAGQALGISNIPHVAGALTKVYIAPANSTVYQLAVTTTGSAYNWVFSNDALGEDLRTAFMDPLPQGTGPVCFWRGRAYAAQYDPVSDQSVVWCSETLGYHLFNLDSDFFLVPGNVVMLTAVDEALIVGTTQRIYAYSGDRLDQLAPYGTVPGQHADVSEGSVYFWTTRGVCSALPFTNLTEAQVSVSPGVRAGGAIVRHGGQKRYVVSLQQGGAAFNTYP